MAEMMRALSRQPEVGYDFITDTFISNDGNGRDADAYDPGDAVPAGYCAAGSAARGAARMRSSAQLLRVRS